MKPQAIIFEDSLTKTQRIAGLIYLPLHMFVLPILLGMLGGYWPSGVDTTTLNIIYYGLGLAFCLTFMWKLLRKSYDTLLDSFLQNIITIFMAYFVYMMLNYMVAAVLVVALGDALSNPNNNAVLEFASENPNIAIGLTVFIGPIVEELLFRGVVFGSLRKKSRVLAYVASMFLFAFCHLWQYALMNMSFDVFIYMLQYIPAGFALAWCYEKTNSLWVPIFLHMGINILSMMLMTAV